jgi:hypothetical protein
MLERRRSLLTRHINLFYSERSQRILIPQQLTDLRGYGRPGPYGGAKLRSTKSEYVAAANPSHSRTSEYSVALRK